MNNVMAALRFDFYITKSAYPVMVVVYILSSLIGFFSEPRISISLIMILCVFFSGLTFSIIEKNRCEKLYGVLPVRRKDIIFGRYLHAFILGIGNELVSVIIVLVTALFKKDNADMFIITATVSLSFVYYCFSVSVAYPVYFKIGFSKSYIFTTLPMYILFLVIAIIGMKTNLLNNISQIIQYFSEHFFLLAVYTFSFGICMLFISVYISYLIYRKAEL